VSVSLDFFLKNEHINSGSIEKLFNYGEAAKNQEARKR